MSLKFSKDAAAASSSRKTSSSRHHHLADPVLAPEEVLFSRTHAPQRYAEKDVYFVHEDLPDGGGGSLPDSDLVKALHGYASHFYEAMGQRHDRGGRGGGGNNTARVDERSMDETALLAVGILLEEAARDSLGRNGDLVFTEGVHDVDDDDPDDHDDDDDDDDDNVHGEQDKNASGGRRRKQATTSPRSQSSYTPVGFEDEPGFWRRKYSPKKRRKTEHHHHQEEQAPHDV